MKQDHNKKLNFLMNGKLFILGNFILSLNIFALTTCSHFLIFNIIIKFFFKNIINF